LRSCDTEEGGASNQIYSCSARENHEALIHDFKIVLGVSVFFNRARLLNLHAQTLLAEFVKVKAVRGQRNPEPRLGVGGHLGVGVPHLFNRGKAPALAGGQRAVVSKGGDRELHFFIGGLVVVW
tara:strand:- start:171 stop:542 length:372 start_codon:yes stop_codon:yes gene_type:complete